MTSNSRQRAISPPSSNRMKKLASTAAAVTTRSWARISHRRGVKLETQVMALTCPARRSAQGGGGRGTNTGLWGQCATPPPHHGGALSRAQLCDGSAGSGHLGPRLGSSSSRHQKHWSNILSLANGRQTDSSGRLTKSTLCV